MDFRKLIVGGSVAAFYAWPMAFLAFPPNLSLPIDIGVVPSREVTFYFPTPEPEPLEVASADIEGNKDDPPSTSNEPIIEVTNHNHQVSPIATAPLLNIIAPEETTIVPAIKVIPKVKRKTRRRRNRYAHCMDNDGIRPINEGFVVEREVIDYYARIAHYRELGHASWHEGDTGERDGFKVRRINCDLREAGVRNGDVVNSVNGYTVRTIPQAIRLWFRMRRTEHIVLKITRRGSPMILVYKLT
jgi:hypothetical protein